MRRGGEPLHWFKRLIMGGVGASAAVAGPLFSRFQLVTDDMPLFLGANAFVNGTLAVYIFAWIAAICIAVWQEEDNLIVCFIDGVGLPGLLTSLLLIGQAGIN